MRRTAPTKAILMIGSRAWPDGSCPRIHRHAGGTSVAPSRSGAQTNQLGRTGRVVREIEECDSDQSQSQRRPEQRRQARRASPGCGGSSQQQVQAHPGQTGQCEDYRCRRVLRIEGGPDADEHVRRMIGENHQETGP